MMNQVIYLRYRPQVFSELIGQDHIVTPLKNALDNDKVAHAYLFSGPRGCGKTTTARILARCLNCEKGVSSKPCGKCQSCKDLGLGGAGSLDVIEMDAASHGHVDDARDLEQKLSFATVRDRYRIIILDEAHMITKEGFNALLKSVEEPPPHVKFIFATTEPEKVISTIRSRTYHYPFKLVKPEILKNYIKDICEKEKVKISDSTLDIVVRAGTGSVRDTESVLDQLISGATINGKIDDKIAISLLGFTQTELLDELINACFNNEAEKVFELIKKAIELGQDERRFLEDVLEILQKHIFSSVSDSKNKNILPFNKLAVFSSIIDNALYESVQNLSPYLHLNVVFSKVLLKLNPENKPLLHTKTDLSTLSSSQNSKETYNSIPKNISEPVDQIKKEIQASPVEQISKSFPTQPKNTIPEWEKIINELKNTRELTGTFLEQNAKFEKIDNKNIYISFLDKSTLDAFQTSNHNETLLKVASQIFSKKLEKVISNVFDTKTKQLTDNESKIDKDNNENDDEIEKVAEYVAEQTGGEKLNNNV